MKIQCNKCKDIKELDISDITEEKISGSVDKAHIPYTVSDYTFECKKCKSTITISFDYWEEVETGDILYGYENFYSEDGKLLSEGVVS